MLACFEALGCRMKVHFLHAHLDYFPENWSDMSEEHVERFHQDIKGMETRCQSRRDVSMMADYCWCLKRDSKKNQKKKIYAFTPTSEKPDLVRNETIEKKVCLLHAFLSKI